MRHLFWITLLGLATGAAGCARQGMEDNRHTIDTMVEEHLADARALPAAFVPAEVAGSAEPLIEAMREAQELAKSNTDELAMLEGLDPGRVASVAGYAGDDVAVLAAVRKGLPLADLLVLAAYRSPGVRAARESWLATVNRFEQADFLENLLGTYRGFVRDIDTRIGPQTNRPMAAMAQPFPSLVALKGEVARSEAGLARIEFQKALRDALNNAANLYFDLQYDFASLGVLDESAVILEQTVPIVRVQVESGGAGQADLLRAQSQLELLKLGARNARNHLRETSSDLDAALGLANSEPWPSPRSADLRDTRPPQAELISIAKEKRQELAAARGELSLMRGMLRLSETMTLPRGPSPMSQLSNSAGTEAGPNRNMMTTFPATATPEIRGGDFPANAAYLEELRRRVTEAERRVDGVLSETEALVIRTQVARENASRERGVYADSIEPNAHQALDSIRESYQAGRTSFNEFLNVEREHLDASLMREQARRDANMAIVAERAATGRSVADLVGGRAALPKGK